MASMQMASLRTGQNDIIYDIYDDVKIKFRLYVI